MKFTQEVHEAYQQAHALAKRSLEKVKKQGKSACPAALNNLTDERMISYRQDLGVMDIPVSLIVGVAEGDDLSAFYTSEFLPVSLPNSDFADRWRRIRNEYLSATGLHGYIQCFEYLGKFYVGDGKKRVSVLKYHKASTVRSYVIRMIPIRTDAKAIAQ